MQEPIFNDEQTWIPSNLTKIYKKMKKKMNSDGGSWWFVAAEKGRERGDGQERRERRERDVCERFDRNEVLGLGFLGFVLSIP